ncbi:MAG: dicarboxylate/amino acid:cation symporter [Flavobacteriales bacterium]|nr:dicarboxylate/amino acid:cation symporter [Flavobacteriales bacterium]
MKLKNKNLALHWQVIIGLVLGGVYAWFAVANNWIHFTMDYINPFGNIFINLLKMIAVPLVLFSIISGIISLKDITQLGRMGIKTLCLYLLTTLFSVSLGLVYVNIVNPGENQSLEIRTEKRIEYEIWLSENPHVERVDDINFLSDPNFSEKISEVRARIKGEEITGWVADKVNKRAKEKTKGPLSALEDVFSSNIFRSLTDSKMLQIIFFGILFGGVLSMIPKEKAKPVMDLVEGLNEVFVKMVMVIMKAMPFFVFALMAGQIVKAAGSDPDKFTELMKFYLWYGGVVIAGLVTMAFIFYPIIVKIFTGLGFRKFLRSVKDAQITAFSTSSSVATLPVTMGCLENNLKVSKSTTSFVLPIGATVNMDGTSLYQGIAVVALAQFHMVDLSILQQLIIVGTATLASIGAAAIPSAGLILMMVVLESVGLNPLWIAIIFPIDRILDMCRTVVNVTGDASVAAIIAYSENEISSVDDL